MRNDALKVKTNHFDTKEEPVAKTQKTKPGSISCEIAKPQAEALHIPRPMAPGRINGTI